MVGLPPGASPVQVAAGGAHTAVLLASGEVWACGLNDFGQAGSDGEGGELRRVRGLPDDVCAVSAGDAHTLAATRGGELYAFGRDADGQEARPARLALEGHVTSVAAGAAHSLALTSAGEVYAWGARAQTGHGPAGWSSSAVVSEPRLLRSLRGVNIVAASAGRTHSGVVDSDGGLHVFGSGAFSQLGNGERVAHAPMLSQTIANVASISCGGLHSLAVLFSGNAYSWGGNEAGALGMPSGRGLPQTASRPWQLPISLRQVSAGWKHSAGVNSRGELYCWGGGGTAGTGSDSSGGQLGLGSESDYWFAQLTSV